MNEYFLLAFVVAPIVVVLIGWAAVRFHERLAAIQHAGIGCGAQFFYHFSRNFHAIVSFFSILLRTIRLFFRGFLGGCCFAAFGFAAFFPGGFRLFLA